MTSDNKVQIFQDEFASVNAQTTRNETIPSGLHDTGDIIVIGVGLTPHMMNLEVLQEHAKEHGLENVEDFVREHGVKITDEEVLKRIKMRQGANLEMDSLTAFSVPKEYMKAHEMVYDRPPRQKTYDHKLHRGKW